MAGFSRFTPSVCLLLAALVVTATTACGGRWRPQQASDVAGSSDPNATYALVLDTLKAQKYKVVSEDAASRTVNVRAHVGERDADGGSTIQLRVTGSNVHVSATGYLVHRDGSTHRTLNSELASLEKQLKKRLGSGASAAPSPADASPAAAPNGALPVAWSEPAYDPAVWGKGNFTCLPVKLADADQAGLTLKLSNGENADVLLSLAHAPELCRSAAECKLPGGCPALGIADAARVSRLAARLSKHEVGPLATLFSKGQPVATIDLAKHGSIAQAMAEKH
ncbi:MAG: hypothetical protein ABW061_29460 [Polyangiaceae bacterium]